MSSKTQKESSFKNKYKSDPEFREKHKEYMLQKVECECGLMVHRCNSKHKKTKKHFDLLEKRKGETKKQTLEEEVKQMKKEIRQIKRRMSKLESSD